MLSLWRAGHQFIKSQKEFIENGLNRIIYCGDHKHCQGFYERFLGLRDATDIPHLRMDLTHSLILPDDSAVWGYPMVRIKINRLLVVAASNHMCE